MHSRSSGCTDSTGSTVAQPLMQACGLCAVTDNPFPCYVILVHGLFLQDINALEQHIKNLLSPATPYIFNTLYDPYRCVCPSVQRQVQSTHTAAACAVASCLTAHQHPYLLVYFHFKPMCCCLYELFSCLLHAYILVGPCAPGRARTLCGATPSACVRACPQPSATGCGSTSPTTTRQRR